MQKDYRFFISSTYEDLKEERKVVSGIISRMGYIPVGMEGFGASDRDPWELIMSEIDRSDCYIVIVAHRYGSLCGEIGYTEREYDYAVSRGKPVLPFLINETADWCGAKYEKENPCMLAKFKDKIRKNKTIAFWSSKDCLYEQVAGAVHRLVLWGLACGWSCHADDQREQVFSSEGGRNGYPVLESRQILPSRPISMLPTSSYVRDGNGANLVSGGIGDDQSFAFVSTFRQRELFVKDLVEMKSRISACSQLRDRLMYLAQVFGGGLPRVS